jgi:thioredoxin reductase
LDTRRIKDDYLLIKVERENAPHMDSGEHFKMTTSSSISVEKKTVIIEVGCGPPVIPSLFRRWRQVAESFNEK